MIRLEVVAAVFALTLPFGFYRAWTRRLSWRWFVAIHAPIPFVFLLRYEAGLAWTFIPFTCLTFAAAQLAGGKAGSAWKMRRDRDGQPHPEPQAGRADTGPSSAPGPDRRDEQQPRRDGCGCAPPPY